METTNRFTYTINIKAPCLYTSNKRINVLKDLENTFTNRCYQGYLIVKVLDIIQMSSCRCINTNQNAIATINVYFEALIRGYTTGDILPKVTVCISEGTKCGVGENAIVTFSNSPNTQLLTNEQIVPIVVGEKIHYNTGSKNVNILGAILLPMTTPNIYHFQHPLDLTSTKYNSRFKSLLTLLTTQENQLNTKGALHFTELLNSYEKPQLSKSKEGKDIKDIIQQSFSTPVDVRGFWSKNLHSSSSSCLYVHSTAQPDRPYLDIDTNTAFFTMLRLCYSFRKGIIDLATTYYQNEQLMTQADTIWELMKENKL